MGTRTCVVALLATSLMVLSGQPSVAVGVATLETQQQLVAPSKGTVIYRGGPGANELTLDRDANSGLQMTDPDVAIVAYHPTTSSQNCTGGLGSASCTFGTYLVVNGEDGDDVLVVRSAASFDPVYVNCGPGYDRAVVSAFTNVDPSCEVVEVV
jgi:hypothetical protein